MVMFDPRSRQVQRRASQERADREDLMDTKAFVTAVVRNFGIIGYAVLFPVAAALLAKMFLGAKVAGY
jgi:hypothetical protein